MKEALLITNEAMSRRLMWYRNLVVCVAVLLVLSPILALILLSWKPLIGLLLLPPLCGYFAIQDGRIVRRWRNAILAMQRSGGLNLANFCCTIEMHRGYPKKTIKAMLETLDERTVR